MISKCSKWLYWALLVVSSATVFAVVGCGTREDRGGSGSAGQVYGSLHVPLVTPEQEQFRLRGALFYITRRGVAVVTIDAERDPNAVALDVELLQGAYEITLRDGWTLERGGDAGAAPVSAALLTANPLSFEIDNARVTELVYSFTTEQGVVTFGRGGVSVSVNVTSIAPSAACNVLDRSSCPVGQTCLLAGDTGRTFCAQPGALPVGSPCSSDQCVAGAQCLNTDPSQPGERVCARFCNPESSFCGCQGITVDPSIGLCSGNAPPGALFSHDFPGDTANACNDWNVFRGQLTGARFDRVTLNGSRGSVFECTEPNLASQVCRALRDDRFIDIACQGHTWTVADCGGGAALAVDSSACGCSSPGNTVRPCNGSFFGGVGTDTCAGVPQTIEVTCEGGNPPSVGCGNGVIEVQLGEACDTNGINRDVLPVGSPLGSTCNATCTAVGPPTTPGACLACAQVNCPTQFANATGSSSDDQNLADVTQLLDCVIGPTWDAGGAIPSTSCFFADPAQPAGSLGPCYCGSTPQATCLASGPRNNQEACGVEVEIASRCNPVTASCVTGAGSNPAVPLGDALQLLNCERAACRAQCGFPTPPDE